MLMDKKNMLTFSGCMQARLELMMLLVQLKALSEGTLVAGTQRYSTSSYINSSITDNALEELKPAMGCLGL